MTARAIFLDRDGVINRAYLRSNRPHPPGDLSELEILPGVPKALQELREKGFRLIVITNQPDVARGTQKREVVEAIHFTLLEELPLDEIRVCYHDDADGCLCRKPSAGLLIEAASKYSLDLTQCVMVGDRWKDMEAGERAGCKTVFIDYNYDEKQPEKFDSRVSSLAEASKWICATIHNEV